MKKTGIATIVEVLTGGNKRHALDVRRKTHGFVANAPLVTNWIGQMLSQQHAKLVRRTTK